MKIGWVRLTMATELDYNISKNGLGEERPMLFKGFLDRGHKVKLLTPVKKKDQKTLQAAKNGDSFENCIVDNSWLKKLEYDPKGFADNCDVLVIENGPLNFTFIDPFFKIPQIRRAIEIINRFEGLVIFYQTDPLLPFPFWRMTMAKYPWSHPKNTPRKTGKGLETHGWGDFDEIFKNKKILVIGKSPKPNEFARANNGPRFSYNRFRKKGLMKFDYLPTGYDKYFMPHIKPVFEKKKKDLIYVGFPRSRTNAFKRYYGNYLDRTHVYGPWDLTSRIDFLERCRLEGMKWYGFIDGFPNITKAYSRSKISINLMPEKAQELGWITSRVYESVFSGCITLGEERTFGIEKCVPAELMIDTFNSDVIIGKILDYSKQEYTDKISEQYGMVRHLNYNYIVKKFEKLVKKYG